MTATNAAYSRGETFSTYMAVSHQLIERMLERLIDAMRADDRRAIPEVWCDFESQVLAHLEAEERYILPAFGLVDRAAAIEVVREHGKIRELLLELGVAIELHQMGLDTFEQSIATLRTHAAREEALLDPWVDSLHDPRVAASAVRHVQTGFSPRA